MSVLLFRMIAYYKELKEKKIQENESKTVVKRGNFLILDPGAYYAEHGNSNSISH